MKDKEILKRLISGCSDCGSCINKKECEKFFNKAGINREISDPKKYIAFADKLYKLSDRKTAIKE